MSSYKVWFYKYGDYNYGEFDSEIDAMKWFIEVAGYHFTGYGVISELVGESVYTKRVLDVYYAEKVIRANS